MKLVTGFKVLVFFAIIAAVGCTEKKIKIACVGDSITEGYGLKKQSETAYPVVLNKILGSEYAVLNCGRSATTMRKKGNFPYWVAKEFRSPFVLEPDVIVIKLGTNDTKPQNWNAEGYLNSYQSMIDTFKTIPGNPKIYACLPVPVFKTKWGINDSTVINGVIPAIKKLAESNDIEIIDLYSTMLDQGKNFPDSIHPNEDAAAKMAEIIAKAIKE